jgi:hypothetical protein
MGRSVGALVGCVVLLVASRASGQSQLPLCYAGFEISPACISERGLDHKKQEYQRKIAEAMSRLGASYKIALRLVNDPVAAGYDAAVADVFTDVVRDEAMRNQSFIINVRARFLEEQPDILFEASALHEVCHVMNDDLPGYHRNGDNIEAAEERCVLRAVGESRYEQYLQAYAAYHHWDGVTYERVLQKVKDVTLVPAPQETDEADRLAAEFFRRNADGRQHFLAYNGALHDATLWSTRNDVRPDPEKLKAIIRAGQPVIFFHNHPEEDSRAAMFPSDEDFGVAGLVSFMTYAEDPGLAVEFRVVQLDGEQETVVSYGFKGTALADIRRMALEHRSVAARHGDVSLIEAEQDLLDAHLAEEAFIDYLQHVCPVDPAGTEAECKTHPEYFLWPSDRFFIHHRAP